MIPPAMGTSDRDYWATLRRDCRHFRSERPCRPHKERGVVCASCDVYDPVEQRITIVKLAADGDVLRTTAFLPGIRKQFPQARIRWLTLASAAPLFAANPYVDEVVVCDGRSVPASLWVEPQDIVYCPDADPQTAALASLLTLAPDGRRIGFGIDDSGRVEPLSEAALQWYLLGISDTRKRANRETYQDLVGASLELPTPVLDRPVLVLEAAERTRAQHWFDRARSVHPGITTWIGIVTGAGPRWPRKQWTLEGQTGFIRAQLDKQRGIVLYGGPDEVERHRELGLACQGGAIIDAGTQNDLRTFAARLDRCDALVTGDTMAMHMATAFAKPSVVIFGPTSSAEIELYGSGEKVFAADLECLCCYSLCDRTPSCMDLVSVAQVSEALENVLARGSSVQV